jgi:hypothetical protein
LWLSRHPVRTAGANAEAPSSVAVPVAVAKPDEARGRSIPRSPAISPSAVNTPPAMAPATRPSGGAITLPASQPQYRAQIAPNSNVSHTVSGTGQAKCADDAPVGPNCPGAINPLSTQPPAVAKLATPPADASVPPVAAAIETASPKHTCAECDSVIARLPAASALAKEDIEMTRLACRSSEGSGMEVYQACVTAQIALLDDAIPMPDLSVLPALDRQLLLRACTKATYDGPATYRRCVTSQLIGLAGAPELPDMSGLTLERKRAVELACRGSAAEGAAAYHTCMHRQAKETRRGPSSGPLPAGRSG